MKILQSRAVIRLFKSLEKAGYSLEDISELEKFKGLQVLKDVMYGKAEIISRKHLINYDTDSFIPYNWHLYMHRKIGTMFELDPTKLMRRESLYQPQSQEKGKISFSNFFVEIRNMAVLNANVLEYLLANQELIPDEWKDKRVYFLGTIYCDARNAKGDYFFVRYLESRDNKWTWNFQWLNKYDKSDCLELTGKGCAAIAISV